MPRHRGKKRETWANYLARMTKYISELGPYRYKHVPRIILLNAKISTEEIDEGPDTVGSGHTYKNPRKNLPYEGGRAGDNEYGVQCVWHYDFSTGKRRKHPTQGLRGLPKAGRPRVGKFSI
jgi:hypothetical protein